MAVPQQRDWSKVDYDFLTRTWGTRRIRTMNNLHYTGPGYAIQTLAADSDRPSVTTKTTSGTVYGNWKRTADSNNSVWLKGKPISQAKGDVGGPFMSESLSISKPKYIKYSASVPNEFHGHRYLIDAYVHPSGDLAAWAKDIHEHRVVSPLSPVTDSELMSHGATGIARTIPTKPEMSLSTSIGELKDGLPSMIGSQLRKEKNLSSLGSEYLNYQFGVLPTINDVSDVIRLTKQYESIIRQFRRDQGRVVRRRTTLVDKVEETSEHRNIQYAYVGGGKYSLQSVLTSDDGSFKVQKTYRTKVWFSGAYAIAYPRDADGLLQEIAEFNRVYGVIPNAELAWNLLPWSWLVDWFSNLGDIITNVSYLTSPSTRLAYGYVMGSSSYTRTESGNFGAPYVWTRAARGHEVSLKSSFKHEYKRRLKASPFGFGVTFGNLSNSQKAILAALGLSRLKL